MVKSCAVMSVVFALVSVALAEGDVAPLLRKECERLHAPGAAAAIVRDGRVLASGVFGVRTLGEPAQVEPADLFLIGSCGKSLTRLLIGRLVDRKLLTFDSTLAQLLPDVSMSDAYKGVTIANVLAHRGGIPGYTEIGPARTPILFEGEGSSQERRARFVAHLLNEPPAAKAGTTFVYSNAGYGLLGHIAERLAKRPYEELMREEVFAPLGMKSAVVALPNSAADRAGLYGHMKTDGGFEPPQQQRRGLPAIAPAGLMSCNVGDFARMAAYLARSEAGRPGEFLTPPTAARLRELRPGDGGEGEPFFGGDGLYTAAFAVWPSRDLAIVVGTNAGDSDDVCAAVIEAIRAAYASDVQASLPLEGEPGRRPLFGFQIEADDSGEWRVIGVAVDSPAAKAGLRKDDRIRGLNGKPLEKLSRDERTQALRTSPLELTVGRDGESLKLTLRAGG